MSAITTSNGHGELIKSLRAEIVETQKTSADFLKWKLIAIATVASIALGLWQLNGNSEPTGSNLIACLIPLICAYVDLVSLDLGLRIMVIASFLTKEQDPYELFVQELRKRRNPFRFAPVAIHLSSVVVNVTITLGAIIGGFSGRLREFEVATLVIASVLGIVITLLLWYLYDTRVVALKSPIVEQGPERAPLNPT